MIGIEIASPTSLGTSTTKTQLGSDIILPSWCKSIVGIIPAVVLDTPTAAEAFTGTVTLESDDFQVQPFEAPLHPIDSVLGATANTFTPANLTYPVHCSVKGGDRLRVYMTPKVANTAAPYGQCGVVVSDLPPQNTQKHAKTGTVTSTGTTAGSDVAGTPYSFTGGRRITELLGLVRHTTLAATDGILGYIRYASSEMQQAAPLKLPLNPISGILGAAGGSLGAGLARAQVDIPIYTPTTVSDFLYMGVAPNTAGYWISAVIFE